MVSLTDEIQGGFRNTNTEGKAPLSLSIGITGAKTKPERETVFEQTNEVLEEVRSIGKGYIKIYYNF
jgi:hypothetical protein